MKFEDILKEIIIDNTLEKVDVQEIDDTTDFISEFGINSIITVKILVDIEEKFSIKLDTDDLNEPIMKNFKSLKEYVTKKVAIDASEN